jgi:hypothetical protein
MAWTAVVSIPGKGKIVLFSIAFRPALRPTQPPIQRVPVVISPGLKRPGHEAQHFHPSIAEVKKVGIILVPPLPNSSSWHTA